VPSLAKNNYENMPKPMPSNAASIAKNNYENMPKPMPSNAASLGVIHESLNSKLVSMRPF